MKRWLHEAWLLYKRPEGREVRHHARIAGAVAFVLTVLELLRDQLKDLVTPPFPFWKAFLILVALFLAFVGAFALIILLEAWLRRPILLQDLDESEGIDGDWVYAMRDADSAGFNRGSIVHVESQGVTFHMKGSSYEVPELQDDPANLRIEPVGEFRGQGVEWTQSRVHYSYYGHERGVDDSGVGYYSFTKSDDVLGIEGRFSGSSLGTDHKTTIRFVKGRRIFTPNEARRHPHAAIELKRQLIEELRLRANDVSVQLSLAHAGSVDGRWIDAIYERRDETWDIIQGSVIRIRSSLEANRFEVKGWTYEWKDLENSPKDLSNARAPHSFDGEGWPLESTPGFAYHFGGFEGTRGLGVGGLGVSSSSGRTWFNAGMRLRGW